MHMHMQATCTVCATCNVRACVRACVCVDLHRGSADACFAALTVLRTWCTGHKEWDAQEFLNLEGRCCKQRAGVVPAHAKWGVQGVQSTNFGGREPKSQLRPDSRGCFANGNHTAVDRSLYVQP